MFLLVRVVFFIAEKVPLVFLKLMWGSSAGVKVTESERESSHCWESVGGRVKKFLKVGSNDFA